MAETEDDGVRAEALRRLRARQLSKRLPGPAPDSSPLPSDTPEKTESPSSDKPHTPG